MSSTPGSQTFESGWHSQPQQQHGSNGQGSGGPAQSDGDPQAAVVAAMQNGAAGGAPSGDQGSQQGAQPRGQQRQESGNSFLDGILAEIDPAHKAIVEPYLGKWNAGVNRRFQELHGELSPFKELGADPDTLRQAMTVYQMIDNDPQQVMAVLQEALAEMGAGDPAGGAPQGQGEPPAPGEPNASAIPPELEQRFSVFEQVLGQMAEKFLEQQGQQAQTQEDEQLDQYMGQLKAEFGEFDEPFVIAQMMSGKSAEDAVQAYNAVIQAAVDKRARTPNYGPVLGGGGAVPQEGKKITDATDKETRGLVASILAASQNT